MNDILIIEELQNQISKKLKQLDKTVWFLKGFQCNSAGNITHLSIQKTRLKGLWPDAIFKLKHLEYLNIQDNELKHIPDKIADLQNLKCLDIRLNQLDTLPNSIKELKLLEKFYLGNNEFKYIPESIQYCPSLKLIDFTENQINDGCENIFKV